MRPEEDRRDRADHQSRLAALGLDERKLPAELRAPPSVRITRSSGTVSIEAHGEYDLVRVDLQVYGRSSWGGGRVLSSAKDLRITERAPVGAEAQPLEVVVVDAQGAIGRALAIPR